MHSNRSPHWQRGRDGTAGQRIHLPTGDREAGLLARAHHGSGRPGERPTSDGSGRQQSAPVRRYTLHLAFEARSLADARERAVGYVEALSLLRPEIAPGAAVLTTAETWARPEMLFCGAVGPDDERCVDMRGHPGFHHGPGVGSLGWGNGDGSGTSG